MEVEFFVSIASVMANSAVFSRCVTFSLQQTYCILGVFTPVYAKISLFHLSWIIFIRGFIHA